MCLCVYWSAVATKATSKQVLAEHFTSNAKYDEGAGSWHMEVKIDDQPPSNRFNTNDEGT